MKDQKAKTQSPSVSSTEWQSETERKDEHQSEKQGEGIGEHQTQIVNWESATESAPENRNASEQGGGKLCVQREG